MTCFAIDSQSPVYDNEDIKNDHGDFAASRATEPLSTFKGMLNEAHLPPFIQQTPKHRPPTTYQLTQTHINLLNHQKFPRNVMVSATTTLMVTTSTLKTWRTWRSWRRSTTPCSRTTTLQAPSTTLNLKSLHALRRP